MTSPRMPAALKPYAMHDRGGLESKPAAPYLATDAGKLYRYPCACGWVGVWYEHPANASAAWLRHAVTELKGLQSLR